MEMNGLSTGWINEAKVGFPCTAHNDPCHSQKASNDGSTLGLHCRTNGSNTVCKGMAFTKTFSNMVT